MTGVNLLIAAVIIVFVIAFIITMLVLNTNAKKIISTNTKLVESQNTLLEQNKRQGNELKMRTSELEEQKNKLEEQNRKIETLQRQQEELAEKLRIGDELSMLLKNGTLDEVTMLREQTRQHREHIELTADMTDVELMAWIDHRMDETRLFTDSNLTLKTMAKSLGLTQKRLGGLFKNHPKYSSLGDYLNEKRFLLACRLLREEPHWTIEAVGAEAGFGGRRTFQTEVKRRLGITPLQYRQSQTIKDEA
jgi:AraC-like DNA-binding protein